MARVIVRKAYVVRSSRTPKEKPVKLASTSPTGRNWSKSELGRRNPDVDDDSEDIISRCHYGTEHYDLLQYSEF